MKPIIPSIIGKAISYIVMSFFAILTIYPILWLFIQAFKTQQDFQMNSSLALPQEWVLGNFQWIWNDFHIGPIGITGHFMNSVFYTSITVISVVLLSVMAGFAFAKLRYKISKLLHGIFVVGILLTVQSIMVPLFLMVHTVGLHDTRLGLLIPYIGLGLPMAIYICTDFIKKGIPDELLEAARIDGASFVRIFAQIVFPMCKPVAATVAIITFTATWNEFILMNILTTSFSGVRSLPAVAASFITGLGTRHGWLFAALTISIIPILIFYFAFRKQITKGVAAGSVKG